MFGRIFPDIWDVRRTPASLTINLTIHDAGRKQMTTTEPVAAAAASGAVSPEPIMRLASGFMAAKHLFAASELGIFEALADSPASLDALAARTGLTRRAARISADAMAALGLVEHREGHYANGPAAAHFLTGRTPADLRPLLRFWDTISYPAWQALAESLGSGPPRQVFDLSDAEQEIVSAGIEAVLAGPCHALAEVVDLSAHRRVLDVGGGTGSWSIAAVRRHAHLRATVLDLPVTAGIARRRISDAGLAERITVHAGDAMTGDLPGGYDVGVLT